MDRPAVITAHPVLAGFGRFEWARSVTYYAWDDWSASVPHQRWWDAYEESFRRLRETGSRTAFFRAPDLLRVRMYRGAREAVRGWRRNLGGLFGGQRGQPGTVARALAVLLTPPLILAAELLTGHWPAAALLWAAGAAASALLRSGSGHAPAWGLLFPCDALFLATVLVLSEHDRRRGRLVSWKGRAMKV